MTETAEARTIVVVGGVAGGASAATRARRMNEQAEIILFERGPDVSFANCGLPYYIGGEITSRRKLLVATAEFLRRRFRLDVRTEHEVLRIDRQRKTVMVRDLVNARTFEQPYDKLVLAPGAAPLTPPLEGIEAPNVLLLRNIQDMDAILATMQHARSKQAVVVGAGFIGLEMVEQLVHQSFDVTLVELQPQVLPLLDPEMAWPLYEEMERRGVDVRLACAVKRFLTDDNGVAVAVELENGTQIETDLIIMGIGVRPENQLAAEAGLSIGADGGIATNSHMQTDDADIYAVGDAAQYIYGVTQQPMRIPLAGPANRAGRLAGEHAATGKSRPMAPVLGTAIVRVFNQTAALTGMTMKQAERTETPAASVTIVAHHHAGYYPGAKDLTLKLVYDPQSGRVLGAQAVGEAGVDKRIDVIATAIGLGATVEDLAGLDLTYAPPFGAAKDPVHMAAFAACNQMDGITEFLDPDANLSGMQVLDVRTPPESIALPLRNVDTPIQIPVDQLRENLDQLDPSAPTVVICHVGVRAHVAARILKQAGFQHVVVLAGGAMLRDRAVLAAQLQQLARRYASDKS